MRILFDQGTPVPLRKFLSDHQVATAFERGWNTLKNGDLLAVAEQNNFEILITTDQHLKYQQNLSERQIAIIVLSSTSWLRIQKAIVKINRAIGTVTSGSFLRSPFHKKTRSL